MGNVAPDGAPEDKDPASYAWVNDGRKFKVLASEVVGDGAGGDAAGAADREIPAPAEVPSTDASPRKNDPKAEGWVPKRAEEIDWSDLPGLDRDR